MVWVSSRIRFIRDKARSPGSVRIHNVSMLSSRSNSFCLKISALLAIHTG